MGEKQLGNHIIFDSQADDRFIEDELANLDITLPNTIISIGNIGLWNGRRLGYKLLGNNVKNILYTNSDYAVWYCDRFNVLSTQQHNDLTNYLEYRILDESKNYKILLEAIHYGKGVNRSLINRYSKSLRPVVASVYGW